MLLGKDYQATSAEDSEIAKEFEMVNYLFLRSLIQSAFLMQISDLNEKKTQISLVLPSVMIFLNKEIV